MSESVADTQQRLEAIIKETYPLVDIGPGSVFSELVTKLAATAQNPIKNDVDTLNSSNAVVEALESIEDTYNPIIDGVASNYNTYRNQGIKSAGTLKVTMAQNRTYFIADNLRFSQPALGLEYVTTAEYTVKADATGASELPLYSEGEFYYFLLPVEATEVGAVYQVSAQTIFILSNTSDLANFVEAKAYGNFTTGLPLETDKQLIARFQSSLTNKSLLAEKSIRARLFDLYPSFQDISVVGANAPEMTRCKHNVFGISTLGTTDIYVRTTLGAETKVIKKTATKVEGSWTFSLNYEDAAGFYRIISIIPSGSNLGGSLAFTATYGYSTTGISPSNLVNNLTEARFTKYQTCEVTFDHAAAGTTLDLDILVAQQPSIGEIQDLFNSNDERIACADYLVKAAIPCYVSIDLTVYKRTSLSTIPVELLKQDIFNYVNTLKFGMTLKVSEIVNLCHKYDISRVALPLTITGEIFGLDSSVTFISNKDALEIPTILSKGISSRTTIFIVDYFKSSGSSAINQNTLLDAISIKVI